MFWWLIESFTIGEGPRVCIGVRFAIMTTKVALVKLIKEFQLSPSAKTPIPMRLSKRSMILSPENDEMNLLITRVNNHH